VLPCSIITIERTILLIIPVVIAIIGIKLMLGNHELPMEGNMKLVL
jgi:hypothetical protein